MLAKFKKHTTVIKINVWNWQMYEPYTALKMALIPYFYLKRLLPWHNFSNNLDFNPIFKKTKKDFEHETFIDFNFLQNAPLGQFLKIKYIVFLHFQTWKKIKSFRGRVLSTIKISAFLKRDVYFSTLRKKGHKLTSTSPIIQLGPFQITRVFI